MYICVCVKLIYKFDIQSSVKYLENHLFMGCPKVFSWAVRIQTKEKKTVILALYCIIVTNSLVKNAQLWQFLFKIKVFNIKINVN